MFFLSKDKTFVDGRKVGIYFSKGSFTILTFVRRLKGFFGKSLWGTSNLNLDFSVREKGM